MNKNTVVLGVVVAAAIAAGGIAASMWKDYQTTARIEEYNKRKAEKTELAKTKAENAAKARGQYEARAITCRKAETFYTVDLVQVPLLEKMAKVHAADSVKSKWLDRELLEVQTRLNTYAQTIQSNCAALDPKDHLVTGRVLSRVLSKGGDVSAYPFDFTNEPDAVALSRAAGVSVGELVKELDMPPRSVCERSYYSQIADSALGAAYSDYLINITAEDVGALGIEGVKYIVSEVYNYYGELTEAETLCMSDDTAPAWVLTAASGATRDVIQEVEATYTAIERSPKFAILSNQ